MQQFISYLSTLSTDHTDSIPFNQHYVLSVQFVHCTLNFYTNTHFGKLILNWFLVQ